ncbi:MAG: inositol monophosphatase [Patescibacteria group bacterium]|jgi:myo-inositol-1(or 4)-monophosphatase
MKKTLLKALKSAGKKLNENFLKNQTFKLKTRNDIVTENDFLSEKIIIKIIKDNFPKHQILSEEIGTVGLKNDYLWIIDPLDATINFAAKIPLYSVSIALIYKNKIEIGGVFCPSLNELFFAQKNKGAYLNNKKIKVSKNNNLSSSLINIGFSAHYSKNQFNNNCNIIKKIAPKIRGLRAFESGALTSCYVACGKLDGKISIKTDPFGNAASTLIIEEAGGKVTDFSNKNWSRNMKTMICSNKILHNKLINFVNS